MSSWLEDLTAEFPPTDRDAWRHSVERALKGRAFADALVKRTAEGLTLEPLYTRGDRPEDAHVQVPGAPPFARGLPDADGAPRRAWRRGATIEHPDAAIANAALLADLEGGIERALIRVAAAADELASSADEARARAASGRGGVWLDTASDLEALLQGVHWSLAPVALVGPASASFTTQLFQWCAHLRERGGHGLFTQIDVIDRAVRTRTPGRDEPHRDDADQRAPDPGASWLEAHIAEIASETTRAADPSVSPSDARPLLIATTALRLAGADIVQEIAAALGTFVALIAALESRGLDRGAIARACEFRLAHGSDVFTEIAKLRAFRACLALALETFGITERAADLLISSVTAEETLTRHDVYVNLLRTTAGATAAVLGGADGIFLEPFDGRTRGGSPLGRRMARNLHSLLAEEADAGAVIDPGGGSFYLEQRTEQIAEAAWNQFVEWERAGGFFAACGSGLVAAAIEERWQARRARLRSRREPLLGVSIFPQARERTPESTPFDADAFVSAWQQRVGAASGAHDIALPSPLPRHHLDDDFAGLRDLADRLAARDGRPPAVFAVIAGAPATVAARLDWVRDLFAAGGLALIEQTTGSDDAFTDIAARFRESQASAAVIVAADDLHEAIVPVAAGALRAAGAALVVLAGRPGEREAAFRGAGIDRFAFIGIDAVQLLQDILTARQPSDGPS